MGTMGCRDGQKKRLIWRCVDLPEDALVGVKFACAWDEGV